MEATHNHQGILSSWLRHQNFSTISVLNRQGEEVQFEGACREFGKYVEGLGPTDAVVLEASTGSFWWADQIEARGAKCFVVDPRKFRIIKDSWNKTDKHDARNLAKALWVHVVTGEFGIPTVNKPAMAVRELRKLFAQYCLLNRQIATHKNNAQAIFVDNGVELKKLAKRRLFVVGSGLELLKEMNVSSASRVCLELTLQVLWKVVEAKERLAGEILIAVEPLRNQVELMISIKGVTPLIALAILADVADIRRFRTLRKMNAYPGLVPRASNSGGKERPGHITRESRKLTRTILTQCVNHVAASSESLKKLTLELGNNAPMIICEDTDVPAAALAACKKSFDNMGQICNSANRIYVAGKIADEFQAQLVKRAKEMVIANGSTNPAADLGPMVSAKQLAFVQEHIADAVKRGARVLCGGEKPAGKEFEKGHFFQPTVLSGVTHEMRIMKEETFGPVAPVMVFDDFEKVIGLANDNPYGLVAYVYTNDARRIAFASEKLEFGTVDINNVSGGHHYYPYAGWKDSGVGIELSDYGLEEYLRVKHIRIDL